MKIRITVTVDVDPEAWALEYGVDPKDVRRDVKEHVTNGVQDQLSGLGLTVES